VAGEIFIVAADAARFADLALPVHADRIPDLGAIGGLLTALDVAAADRVVVVACDLPFLHAGVLARLVALSEDGDGAWVHTPRGPEPLLACYRRAAGARVREAVLAGLRRASDLGSALRMIALDEDELATYGPPDRLLANINTPGDYARVQ
jgi:molybdopterin-guanine dinucleotide biosynthesis protein A